MIGFALTALNFVRANWKESIIIGLILAFGTFYVSHNIQVSYYKSKIADMKQEIAFNEKLIEAKKQEVAQLTTKIDEQNKSILELKSRGDALKKKISDLTIKLKNSKPISLSVPAPKKCEEAMDWLVDEAQR